MKTVKSDNPDPGWHFDNSYSLLPNTFFSHVLPSPAPYPKLIVFNQQLATKLGLDFSSLTATETANILSGNMLPKEATPLAQAYAGHQYGHFTMLGDGRALLIGEQLTPNNLRRDIYLKGSGPTPYARGGDGKATLGPMLREYIISAAMSALNIPTTESLAVIETGESVYREQALRGAILVRIAASHLRVGTFQYAALQNDLNLQQQLLMYTLKRHYPTLLSEQNPALALLQKIMQTQIALITEWMRVGFIHGVMNTDNMTISGETIDYGPCAFMDSYDPQTVFSSIDRFGRYAFINQPPIAHWNLTRFAESLLPLLHHDQNKALEIAQATISTFAPLYTASWLKMMRQKLGIIGEEETDAILINQLLNIMEKHHLDYTNTFFNLTYFTTINAKKECSPPAEWRQWENAWKTRIARNNQPWEISHKIMQTHNPWVIPRNHIVENILSSATESNNLEPLQALLKVLSEPYLFKPDAEYYQQPSPPNTARYQTFCGT